MKKVIIIGAGVSGLAAAARLSHAGFEVEILEKNSVPGGRMGLIQKDGFSFDLGPTIVMMPDVYREVFSFCGKNPDDYIPMRRLDPIYNVYFPDGEVHRASSELSDLIGTLERVGQDQTAGYLSYLADVYKRYLIAKDNFIEKTFDKPTDFYNPRTLAAGLKLKTFSTAYDSIGRFVDDERLKELLSFQTLYIGVSPYNGPSIYTIIPMIELIYGVFLIEGGMYSMARGMERLIREEGGEIRYGASVDEILIEEGRAVGVRVGEDRIPADFVISTADFPYAVDSLLPKGFRQGKYEKKNIRQKKYSCSCLLYYLGLDKKDFPGLTVHNLAFSGDFKGNLDDIFAGRFPADPSIYVYAPGKEIDGLAPDGCLGLYVLVPVPNRKDGSIDWEDPAVLASYRKRVFDKVRQILPLNDFERHVISETVYTPLDFEKDFNAFFGATFGLRPTLTQSNHLRPQTRARKCKGLYFAGSSNHPGAGVPIVLTGAKITAEKVIEDATL